MLLHPIGWCMLVVLFISLMIIMKRCNVHDGWNETQKTVLVIVLVIYMGFAQFLKFQSQSIRSSLTQYRTKREHLCQPILERYTREYNNSSSRKQPVFIYKHYGTKIMTSSKCPSNPMTKSTNNTTTSDGTIEILIKQQKVVA